MNNEDKALLQKAKKVLNLNSNGEIAEAIGNKKENAIINRICFFIDFLML